MWLLGEKSIASESVPVDRPPVYRVGAGLTHRALYRMVGSGEPGYSVQLAPMFDPDPEHVGETKLPTFISTVRSPKSITSWPGGPCPWDRPATSPIELQKLLPGQRMRRRHQLQGGDSQSPVGPPSRRLQRSGRCHDGRHELEHHPVNHDHDGCCGHGEWGVRAWAASSR